MIATGFADSIYKVVDIVSLYVPQELKNPSKVFANLAKKYPQFLHNDMKLVDNIKVCFSIHFLLLFLLLHLLNRKMM